METIGHHTCKKEGGEEYVLENAPFISTYDPKEKLYPFLGTGYYYWDNNIELAKWWGEQHYNNNFFVVESNLDLNGGIFFDLVGNREHQMHFVNLMNLFKQKGYENKKWPIAAFIEYIKKIATKDVKIFPFTAIRAIDFVNIGVDKDLSFTFVQGVKGALSTSFTHLGPRMIVCLFQKNCLVLPSVIAYAS